MKHELILIFTLVSLAAFGQAVGVGQWKDYLPYGEAINLTEIDNTIFVATKHSLFTFDKDGASLSRLSKTNGLSDIGIKVMKKDPSSDVIIIAYENGNLDFLAGQAIYNLSDIKRENLVGEKSINNIFFSGNKAYLSCSFGIIELALDNREITNTYHLNSNKNLSINDLALFNDSLFAATDSGLYAASVSDNLSDFHNWESKNFSGNSSVNQVVAFNNELFVSNQSDTIYLYNGEPLGVLDNLRGLKISNGRFFTYSQSYIHEITENQNILPLIHTSYFYKSNDVIVDTEGVFWVADGSRSLARAIPDGPSANYIPESPNSHHVFSLCSGTNLFVSTGGVSSSWNNNNLTQGLYWSDGFGWSHIDYNQLGETRDITTVLQDPNNSNNIYIASWNGGVLKLVREGDNYQLENVFSHLTTKGVLEAISTDPNDGTYGWVRVKGMAFDNDGNLWIANSQANNTLVVKTVADDWLSFPLNSMNTSNTHFGDRLIDDLEQKWMVPKGGGLVVYSNNGTLENPNDDLDKTLSTTTGNGGLPANDIYSLAKDRDGEIWVGTNKGIAVFYSPENIFSGNDYDAQQILVEVDGYVEHLLTNETVTAIAVDGANRKWLGTQTSGVYLVSEDGTQPTHHFTEANSPLFSNTIMDIAINHETGEVYLGTTKGLVSYKSDATGGGEKHGNVLVYPNPVRENYNGTIAIKGLVEDADVKITDLSGALVFATKALGGQAVWNGKNDFGARVQTGVYLVFSSNPFGTETNVAKILFIH